VDTLASLQVPKTSAPDIRPPSEDRPPSLATIASEATLPTPGFIFPFPVPFSRECATPLCESVATHIREKVDYSVDPCKDFYKYVCGKFRGEDEFSHLKYSSRITTLNYLQNAMVPPSNQRPWEKAAAMFQACVSFASSYLPETIELVRWMISMNLDFYNTTRLAAANPVEVMVRGSLDLGVHVMLAITFQERNFIGNKRAAQIEFSKEEDTWLDKRSKNGFSTNIDDYSLYFLMSGIRRGQDYGLAAKILRYERRLQDITKTFKDSEAGKNEAWTVKKHVKKSWYEWASYFSKYTNGTYRGFDVVLHQPHTTKILYQLFESKHVGAEGLRYLVAWSILRQLADFTEPYLFRGDRSATDACYEHIKKVMNLAITSHFFGQEGSRLMVNQTERMVSQVRSAFRDALLDSLWIGYKEEVGAIRNLDDIVVNVGSPGRRLDPEFIDEYYKAYPDVPVNRLFPSWIKALSLSTHSIWSDQTTVLYDDDVITARYIHDYNIVVIPTAIINRPFFYLDAPMALNYGGLGMPPAVSRVLQIPIENEASSRAPAAATEQQLLGQQGWRSITKHKQQVHRALRKELEELRASLAKIESGHGISQPSSPTPPTPRIQPTIHNTHKRKAVESDSDTTEEVEMVPSDKETPLLNREFALTALNDKIDTLANTLANFIETFKNYTEKADQRFASLEKMGADPTAAKTPQNRNADKPMVTANLPNMISRAKVRPVKAHKLAEETNRDAQKLHNQNGH
ncbi:hypothetical protein MTO96_033453, partial [Rhipicephalus appendiculatus]